MDLETLTGSAVPIAGQPPGFMWLDRAERLDTRGDHVLYRCDLRGPDETFTIPLIVADLVIFGPWDWQGLPPVDSLEDADRLDWCDLRTGARAVMLGGLPYLSPFTAGPDARPGSYGQ